MRKICLLFFVVVFCSCRGTLPKNATSIEITKEDLTEAVYLFDSLKETDFLLLETNDSCLIPDRSYYFITGNRIWVVHNLIEDDLFLFDRETGRFICRPARKGKAPEDYFSSCISFFYPPEGHFFCRDRNNGLIEYDQDGKCCKKIPFPRELASKVGYEIGAWALGQDSLYYAYFNHFYGNQKLMMVSYTADGEMINVYPRRNVIKRPYYNSELEGLFYRYQGKLFFYEQTADTIFEVTHRDLKPYLILGKTNIMRQEERDVQINSLWETEDAIWYGFVVYTNMMRRNDQLAGKYISRFDKKTKKKLTYRIEYAYRKYPDLHIGNQKLVDMIQYGVDFWQDRYVSVIHANTICDYFENERDFFQEHVEFMGIKEDDNAVLMFQKCPVKMEKTVNVIHIREGQ